MSSQAQILDALIIGAGPAGLGTALALDAVEGLTFGVLERGQIGQTFLDWPAEQTFLTPSFTGNGFGATDLNAIHPETSPAYTLGVDYPNGRQYAKYLRSVAQHFQLPVLSGVEATSVSEHDAEFEVQCAKGPVLARSLVWAGGEFHQPVQPRIAGSTLTNPAASTEAWQQRTGKLVVIGGYESGIDIACHHVERGAQVTVVDRSAPWQSGSGSDPSYRLAPRSRIRLSAALDSGRLTLIESHATGIKRAGDEWLVSLGNGKKLRSDSPPIAATGYGPGLGLVEKYFTLREDGWPELDEYDQSTLATGLFLTGPSIRHDRLKFCFIYKFRQRFAHIARVIGERAGKDVSALESWRAAGMLTDDLTHCGVECAC